MEYRRLKGELRIAGVTQREVASGLDMTVNNLCKKFAGAVPMTVDELLYIVDTWLPHCSIDMLLERSDKQ